LVDVSICIVNWNTENVLKECLRSVYETTRETSFEIFVVDNASRDKSVEMVRNHFPHVTLIFNSENKGFATASNQAICCARGRYVMLLNPDTIVHGRALDTMVRFMDEHPEAGAIGCKLLNEDGTVQNSVRRFLTFGIALRDQTLLGKIPFLKRLGVNYKIAGFPFHGVEEVDTAGGAALMIRKTVLDKVGFLDEGYFMFIEEMDLCRRIWAAEQKVYYVPDAVITHLGGESRKQVSEKMVLIIQKSLMQYFTKFEGPGKTLLFKILYKPFFVLGLIYDLILDFFYVIKYNTIKRNRLKSAKRVLKIRGTFHFFTKDLGYFIFKL